MLFGRIIMFFMALLLAMVLPLQAGPPKGQPVNPLKQWSGSVDDLFLMKGMPKFIISAEELEKLWQAWKVSGPVPQVDFSKELVLVATSRGSILHLSPILDDKGDLTDVGLATMDLLPGFRYVIAVVSRERVKTVNGKELTAKAEKSHPKTNSAPELADFGVSGVEVQSVKTMDTHKINAEVSNAVRKDEAWTQEAVLVALKFIGSGLKGHTKIIDVRTPPEQRDTATITVTESGYLDDAINGERWRLWLVKGADGIWTIQRALWAQLCDRPGRRFYSAGKCP